MTPSLPARYRHTALLASLLLCAVQLSMAAEQPAALRIEPRPGTEAGGLNIRSPLRPGNVLDFRTCEGLVSGSSDLGLFKVRLPQEPGDGVKTWRHDGDTWSYTWAYEQGLTVHVVVVPDGSTLKLTYTVQNVSATRTFDAVQLHTCITTTEAPAFFPSTATSGSVTNWSELYHRLHLWSGERRFSLATATGASTNRHLSLVRSKAPPVNWGWWVNAPETFDLPLIALGSRDGRHTLALGFDSAIWASSNTGDNRACFHLFPWFGTLAPGQNRTVNGRLYLIAGGPEEVRDRFQTDFPTAAPTQPEQIPPKTVVLTFDDAVRSQIDVVAPLLKERGFGATFFISHGWMNDREHFLDWQQVGALYEMGFEIGNHTWTHASFNTPRAASRLAGELALVEIALTQVGVPKPISFAWPGNAFCPESLDVLSRSGYRLARRGMQPEAPYGTLELGPLFDPTQYHPLLIPSAGDAYPNWTLDHFKQVVDRTTNSHAPAIVQFHGVPDVAHPWVNTPEDRFRTYLDYLKQGGFHVIALRDLLRYTRPPEQAQADPLANTRYPAHAIDDTHWPIEVKQTMERLNFWLPIMVRDHGYTIDEALPLTTLSKSDLEQRLATLGIPIPPQSHAGDVNPAATVRVLPYPGGRHPRIGFLDGAIAPQRGTKASIFPPWTGGGYVVLDIPEAIFSNMGLLYLAHTHVPTVWDNQNVTIDNRDWIPEQDGSLRSEWRLPNGVAFGAQLKPDGRDVSVHLWMENGTTNTLSALRTQVCLMLKAAPGFNEQSQERKSYEKPLAVVKATNADRYILLAFDHCGRTWGNEQCPCVHSDPVLPDATPGGRVSVHGRLAFYEGPDIRAETQRVLNSIR